MIRKVAILWLLLVVPFAAMAAWFGEQFSADAVQQDPQTKQWKAVGKMYVGQDRLRLESFQGDQTQVMIIDGDDHVAWMLNPAQQVYMEMKGMQTVPMLAGAPLPDETGSPCQDAKMQCKKLGDEKIDGVTAEKWEFVVKGDSGDVKSTQWFDRAHEMAIRQEFPDGQVITRKYEGKAKIGGRETEKWEVSFTQGDKTQNGIEYIDRSLNVVVRQEQSGGQVTALSDIKVAPQPASLFSIPPGYRKQEMGQRSGGGGMPSR